MLRRASRHVRTAILNRHAPLGNLGYALKYKCSPGLPRACDSLTRAVQLRGNRVAEGVFYQYSRALCLIQLDPNFPARQPASKATRDAVLAPIRQARRELDETWDEIMAYPDSADIRTWLDVNGSPRLG